MLLCTLNNYEEKNIIMIQNIYKVGKLVHK